MAPSPLADLLRSMDLAALLPALEAEDLDLDGLAALTDPEWRELGVSLGNRKRIQAALAERGYGIVMGTSGAGRSGGHASGGISDQATAVGGEAPAPTARPALRAGLALGPFTLVRKLGAGAFGEVWEADDSHGGERCALKIVASAGPVQLAEAALVQEFSVLRRVTDQTHIVRAERPRTETLDEHRLLLLPMELADGGTLRDWMAAHPAPAGGPDDDPDRLDAALDLFAQACAGVQALHDANAVHLDLKPANLLLVGGVLKVADFGLSRDLSRLSAVQSQLLSDGVGTPTYMAPEQFEAARPEDVSPAADIWALGVILYELLDGKPPFSARSTKALEGKILNRRLAPNLRRIPERFHGVVARCLSRQEDERPASAMHLGREVAAIGAAEAQRRAELAAEQEEADREQQAARRRAAKEAEEERARRQTQEHARKQEQERARLAAEERRRLDARQKTASEVAATARTGPDERPPPARWGPLPWVAGGAALVLLVGLMAVGGRGSLPATDRPLSEFDHALPSGPPIRMVRLPGGSFDMGSPKHDGECEGHEPYEHGPDGGPVHITLPAFSLGKTEVTNAQYAAFLTAHGSNDCRPPGGTEAQTCVEEGSKYLELANSGGTWTTNEGKEQHPVVDVSWYGALAFATWAGAHLPTEAQWESACRAGTQSTWAGTDDEDQLTHYANVADQAAKRSGVEWSWVGEDWATGDDGSPGLAPVGSRAESAWGLQDLSGNVWEWTASEWSSTLSAETATTAASPPSGAFRVLRGGSFWSSPTWARCAYRPGVRPSIRGDDQGFRVALPSAPQR